MSPLRVPLPRVSPALDALCAAIAHHRLESGVRLAMPGAGRHVYAQYAAALWGWLQPIEMSMWSGGWPAEAEVPSRAVKSRWLEEDLEHARRDGYLDGEIVRREERSAFRTLAQRMGCAFVVESSLTGIQVLRRRVAPALFPWPARFLSGYGEEGAERWRDFLAVIEKHLDSEARIDDAARSATRTIDSLAAWLRAQGAA